MLGAHTADGMAALHLHLRLLMLTAALCMTITAPVDPAATPSEVALSPAGQFGLDGALLHQTGAALASQHSRLMTDTDVFGLYGAPATPAAPQVSSDNHLPALFPDPFGAFDETVAPVVDGVLPNGLDVAHILWIDQSEQAVQDTAEYPGNEALTDDAKAGAEVREGVYTRGGQELTTKASQRPAVEPVPSAVLSDGGEAAARGGALPLMATNRPVLCLLPHPSRHAAPPAPTHKHNHPARQTTEHATGATQSGDKHAAGRVMSGADTTTSAADTADTADTAASATGAQLAAAAPGRSQNVSPQLPAIQLPLLSQDKLGKTVGAPPSSVTTSDRTAFEPPWSEAGPTLSAGGRPSSEAHTGQPLYPSPTPGTAPDTPLQPLTTGTAPETLLQPLMVPLFPGQPPSIGNTERRPLEQMRSPTYFAQYPRQSEYPSSQSQYPGQSEYPSSPSQYPGQSEYPLSHAPVAGSVGFYPEAVSGAGADSAWPYTGRSPMTTARRQTAQPAPWLGPGQPPAAGRWPWPALSTESRGRPAAVPSSAVLLVGGLPLYSQWYRPAVVPLPGGGRLWGRRWRSVRPATAMATSEQSVAGSPPLGADWPWPAVSMIGGQDALVVTGLGSSSGAMARAAGRNGWPPVAMATAGGSAAGGSFSRASSGGFDLIFQDGMFATGPMALRMAPEERVGPNTRPKAPHTAAGAPDAEPGAPDAESGAPDAASEDAATGRVGSSATPPGNGDGLVEEPSEPSEGSGDAADQ